MLISPEYLAGFFDGEGSISLTGKTPSLTVRLCNTYKDVIVSIYQDHGGCLSDRGNAWLVSWGGTTALKVVAFMYPHLIVKKAQADLALAHQDIVFKLNKKHPSQEEKDEREWFRNELIRINGSRYWGDCEV